MIEYTPLIERLRKKMPSIPRARDAADAIEALQARVVELDNDTADLAMLADQYKAERDTLAAKLAALEGQKSDAFDAVSQKIVQRYRVEKTNGGFWPCCVKAGDGTMDIFVGSRKQAERVRQALQTACLDGAFMASKVAAGAQAYPLTDAALTVIKRLLSVHEGRKGEEAAQIAKVMLEAEADDASKIGGSV